jgi:quercetin dioxygenase-like cupin family protein/sugar lactone lactonase YvrE
MLALSLVLALVASVAITAQAPQTSAAADPRFTGVSYVVDAKDVSAARRRFEAGARSAWHSHDRGQLLWVESGRLRVGKRDQPFKDLAPGESDYTAPNVDHWHGAVPQEPAVQVYLNFVGETRWKDKVTDAEYLGGQKTTAMPVNDMPNPFRTVEGWAKMPAGRTWGSTSAVDIDRDGKSVWVAERCGANTCEGSKLPSVLKFDADGNLVKSFGAGMLVFPHGIHVDRDGNVWVTDAQGSKDGKVGHQVIKFSPEGKVLMRLGKAGVAGNPPAALTEPNDVVTNANGDIFVAEGHSGQNANAKPDAVARISKFDKNGKFIKSWGKLGREPGDFRTPHALALDSRGRLFVADRGNLRLQIFDQDGKFLEEWKQFSRISGLYIDRNDTLYAADSESSESSNPGGWKRGIRIGSARNGEVMMFIPDPETKPTGTSAAEGVAVDAAGNVYGAEVGPRALKRYERR